MNDAEIVERLIDTENRAKSNTHRLDKLEQLTDSMNSLAKSVALMAQKQESMSEKLDETCADVKELKNEPADYWKEFRKAALTAVVAAVIGYVLAHVGL